MTRDLIVTLRDGRVFEFDADTTPIEDYLQIVKTCTFLHTENTAVRCSEITSLEIQETTEEGADDLSE
ncbi:hypothetical protein [Mesobacillus zeae]|uniref:hypothetical protein n=1 Tax=Mesobacillus zeae TaxID=1917180 RepID=UPI00300B0462